MTMDHELTSTSDNNGQNDVGMPRHKEAISCEMGRRGDVSTETDLKPSSK